MVTFDRGIPCRRTLEPLNALFRLSVPDKTHL
jgi:hypothetical protein